MRAHLATCAACHGAIAPLFATAGAGASRPLRSDLVLGPYKLLQSLGRGGQAEVFLAEDSRLERKVALKVFSTPADRSNPAIKRFRREALAASVLDHPGICTVYEAAEADGLSYIAMRYIPGVTLLSAVSQGTKSIPRTTRLIERLARALHAAHEAGLIHRDVKPGNVIVTPEDEPVILDFGLAHLDSADGLTITRSGDVVGTPAYMSPEQLQGDRERVDRRTDVYSVGVTLFQCLTGRLPHEAATRDALYRKILTGDRLNAKEAGRDLPRDLVVILEKALETSPQKRYATALELAEDLRRYREFEPIRARPAGPGLRLRRWAQRNPVIATALSAGFVALAGGLTIALLLLHAVSVERDAKESALGAAKAALGTAKSALERADGERLIAQSATLLPTNPALALLLAVEGSSRAPGLTARNAVFAALGSIQERRALLGSGGPVQRVAFSPDGQRVAGASSDGTARIWSLESGEEVISLRGHEGAVSSARFSANGARVATASLDGTARIWDSATGHEQLVVWGGGSVLFDAALSPDGGRLVVGSDDQTARVHSTSDGRVLAVSPGQGNKVLTVEFSRDGSRVLAATISGTVTLLDGFTLEVLGTKSLDLWPSHGAHLDPGGGHAALVSGHGDVRILELGGWTEESVLRGHLSTTNCASFSSDGSLLVTASDDGTAKLWNVRDVSEVACLRGHDAGVSWAEISPDSSTVATASTDGTVRVWDVRRRGEAIVLPGHSAPVRGAAFHPDGLRVVTCTTLKTVTVWDLESRSRQWEVGAATAEVNDVTFSPDGTRILATTWNGVSRVLDAQTGELLAAFGADGGHAAGSFSPDGRRVATGVMDGTVRIWDASSGQEELVLSGRGGFVASVSFSPGGERIASGSEDGALRVWDSSDGRLLRTLDAHAGVTNGCCFTPDGGSVAAAYESGDVVVWSVADGKEVLRAHPHDLRALSVDVSPDGKWLLTASEDRTARLLLADGGKEWLTLRDHAARVNRARFSRDGTRIVTSSEDLTARVYRLPGEGEARRRLPRALTPGEREAFEIGSVEGRQVEKVLWDLAAKWRAWKAAARMLDAGPRDPERLGECLRTLSDVVCSIGILFSGASHPPAQGPSGSPRGPEPDGSPAMSRESPTGR